ncbi:MAG: ABC transporter permease [Lachnospiraceae bacterium]|nr:ABC transporter permease [Lachnospiraceae bacterium]
MQNNKSIVRKVLSMRELPLLVAIILGVVILSFYSPTFFTTGNMHSVFLGSAFESIKVIGMTLLLIQNGIDLSIGSIAGFTGVMVGIALDFGANVPMAIVVGLLAATVVGMVNGFIIAHLKINAMICTLAMQMIVRGLIFIVTRGVGRPNFPDAYNAIARINIFGLQAPIIYSLVLLAIFGVLFAKSGWFRQFYFIGGNEEAAQLSGIKVVKLRFFAYTFCGFMAGISGVLLAARMGGAIPTQGQGMEMNVIAAAVIGGASISGGKGTILGSFLGVLVMSLVINAFNVIGVDIYWQRTILGSILLLAIMTDKFRARKSN